MYLFPSLLLLRGAGGLQHWLQSLWRTGACIGHDGQSTGGQEDIKRDEVQVLGDGGLVGRSGDAVVAGPALLLYLDDADASTVAAKATVLPGAAVTGGEVSSCHRIATATLLLWWMHLETKTGNTKTGKVRLCLHHCWRWQPAGRLLSGSMSLRLNANSLSVR